LHYAPDRIVHSRDSRGRGLMQFWTLSTTGPTSAIVLPASSRKVRGTVLMSMHDALRVADLCATFPLSVYGTSPLCLLKLNGGGMSPLCCLKIPKRIRTMAEAQSRGTLNQCYRVSQPQTTEHKRYHLVRKSRSSSLQCHDPAGHWSLQ